MAIGMRCPTDSASWVEPGHQFEWSWLLSRWALSRRNGAATTAASRLLAIGEDHGVDRRRNVAVDELDDGFAVLSDTARLWPQTERIKAWDAALSDGREARTRRPSPSAIFSERSRVCRSTSLVRPPGSGTNRCGAMAASLLQDCRASSLYHIVCAIDTMSRVDADRDRTTLP